MRTSDAMDLEPGVFLQSSGKKVAESLKRSVLASTRRKAPQIRSAMSMLNFHLNRSGKGLSASRRRELERAKNALRRLFDRPAK